MDEKVKIIAMYLPQYHVIPENSAFWGEGFTDWVSVKQAVSLFEGHRQPKIPKDSYYYDLSEKSAIRWQIQLAKEYGVYGFGIYHYWFSSETNLLTKPATCILDNPELDIPFCFAWDNISWKRTWGRGKGNDWSPLRDVERGAKKGEPEILIPYRLGGKEEWKKHFQYLLPYFLDSRYIRKNEKPLFVIYHYSDDVDEMMHYWDALAVENKLPGVEPVYRYDAFSHIAYASNSFTYEPSFSGWGSLPARAVGKVRALQKKNTLRRYDYDIIWKKILLAARKNHRVNQYYGCFVTYDDTPRRGMAGKVVCGGTPEKFERYIQELYEISCTQGKEFLFLTAWNEWGEGAYLEPDEADGICYLEALRRAVKSI